MANFKVYTGNVSPTLARHRTEEEYAFWLTHSSTEADLDEVTPEMIFREEGTPEGFESETLYEAMRYANTLRKMAIYEGVWIEFRNEYGVRKIEYVHSDYLLHFKSADCQEFIEGDDFNSLRNLAQEMAKEQQGVWGSFEIYDYYSGGRLLWRLGYREWQEKENARRNFWAVMVFLLFVFVVHYLLIH